MNLRQKLFLTQTLGAAALALTMSVLVDRTVVKQVQMKEEANLELTRAAFSALKENQERQLLQQARLISDLPHFKAAMAVMDPSLPPMDQPEAVATIRNVAERILVGIDADLVGLTDYRGAPITAAGVSGPSPTQLPLGNVSREALQRGSGYEIVESEGRLVSLAAVPVRNGGTVFGALSLGLYLDDTMAAALEEMSGSAVALVGKNGLVAASPGVPDDFVNFVGEGHRSGIPGSLSIGGDTYKSLWVPINGSQSAEHGAFVVLRSEAQALQFLRSVRSGLVTVGLVAAILGLMVAYVFARQITTPVQALVEQTERLGRGDFEARLDIQTGDELGRLASAFNRMGESLAESRAQLLQAGKLAAMGELGAGLAHELRQPLTSIRASAQLTQLQLPEDNQKSRNHLQLILDAVDHMNSIIQGLRDFSRKSSFERAPVHIDSVLSKTAALMDSQFKSDRLKLEVKTAPGLPPVLGNANQLQQVFVNLISNARDAMKVNGGTIRLTAAMSPLGDAVTVSVADQGPGIPEEVLPNIFQSFFTTKEEGQGTGLGLPITKSIVTDHGGSIEVSTSSNRGTTFVVTLPVAESAGIALRPAA